MERAAVPGLERRRRRVRFARALLVLSVLSLSQVPGAVLAQINIWGRGTGIDLTKEDQDMLMEAGSRLHPDSTPIGKSEAWSNPQSGN
jgi:hypothetical protein